MRDSQKLALLLDCIKEGYTLEEIKHIIFTLEVHLREQSNDNQETRK